MGLFSGPNPFDGAVDKVTDAKNTSEDWGQIMDLCDRVQGCANGPKDCLRAIVRRLNHQDPHIVVQAITVLDACVNNCGKSFRLEVASREFETEFRRLLSKSHPKVQERLRGMLKAWAEGEFKGDSQLSLIPSLYSALRREGVDFSSTTDQPKKTVVPKDPNVVSSQQEEDDIAKAIQLSLQESKSGGKVTNGSSSRSTSSSSNNASSSLYPSNSLYGSAASEAAAISNGSVASSSDPKKEVKKARALYDFEAAEDNELTFKAGEIVIIIDDSDVNWWKGSNHRGEGLFPANFVTTDLEAEPEQFKEEKQRRRSVQFNEEVEVVQHVPVEPEEVELSEAKIDSVMRLLHEADPTSPESDPPELPVQEDCVNAMGPIIDAELQSVDRRHAQLTRLSTELVDALNLYHQLMHENTVAAAAAAGMGMGMPPAGAHIPPGPQEYGSMPYMPQMYPSAGGVAPQPPTGPPSTTNYMSPPYGQSTMTGAPAPVPPTTGGYYASPPPPGQGPGAPPPQTVTTGPTPPQSLPPTNTTGPTMQPTWNGAA